MGNGKGVWREVENHERGGGWWRRARMAAVALVVALALSSCALGGHPEDSGNSVGPGPAPTTTAPGTAFSHVFIIVLENEEVSAVLGNDRAPYVSSLAAQYATAAQYFAVTHPSLPNYLSLTAGTPQPLDGLDCSVGPDCHVAGTHTNIADEIEASGRTWMAYMESMPAPCTLQNAGTYAVRHNPFVYFDDIRTGANDRCATHDVPYDAAQFASMLQSSAMPNFVWITPNLCNDGHDSCGGDGVAHSDAWLAQNVPPILASPAFQQGGVLFITWDEGGSDRTCCGLGEGGGQVATLVISPHGKRGYQSQVPYNHYSLLRTIEDGWQLGELGNTNPAVQPGIQPMSDLVTGPQG
jgi:phosphatidylinositol-3-phosphatase